MFEFIDHYDNAEASIPRWLADDIGVPPSTRLLEVKRVKRRRTHLGSSRRPEGAQPVALFEGLSRKELRLVSKLSTPVDFPAGTVLAREGEVGAEFFVVLEGQVEVLHGDRVIATRGPGSPLGEVALLEDRPRTATLRAVTPVSTRVTGRREFSDLMVAVPQVSERLHAIIAARNAA